MTGLDLCNEFDRGQIELGSKNGSGLGLGLGHAQMGQAFLGCSKLAWPSPFRILLLRLPLK